MQYLYITQRNLSRKPGWDVPRIVCTLQVTHVCPGRPRVNNCDHLVWKWPMWPMWNTPWPEPWTMCFLLPLYSYPPWKFFLVVFAAEEYIYDHSGCDVNADAWHGWKVVFRYFVEGCNVGLMKGSKKDKLLRKSVTISIKGTIWHPSCKTNTNAFLWAEDVCSSEFFVPRWGLYCS